MKGHSASSAHHWHETKLLLEYDQENQSLLADRNINPTKADFYRLFEEWRKKDLGPDQGKPQFDQLNSEIAAYINAYSIEGGKAAIHIFKGLPVVSSDSDSEADGDATPKKKKAKKVQTEQPMILTICTPLMSRVHQHIRQASQMVFCDSTSSLDRFNTSLFILSTSYPTGGLPLAAMITSDEKESTIKQGLEMIKSVVPENTFYGCGSDQGPAVVMTDDCRAERNALQKVWPHARLLLCTFHFLQSKWTWLHNGQNKIHNFDRQLLMLKTKKLVYAATEGELFSLYDEFKKCELVKKYPKCLAYIKSHWDQRKEWALCYRKHLLVRGNHTNNYAEAGIRIVKDLVFNRVKAYNIVQMFTFVTECLEMYYSRKLLSVAHNRVDHYISIKYQGMKCSGIGFEQISILDKDEQTYLVESQTERGVKYFVDMSVGICSCIGGQDGSPCSHQAAIVKHHGVPSVNCIPTLSSSTRQEIAVIAIGCKAIQEPQFYASLHQEKIESGHDSNLQPGYEEFTGTGWDLIQSSANFDESDEEKSSIKTKSEQTLEDLEDKIKGFSADITARAKENPLIHQAMQTFLR